MQAALLVDRRMSVCANCFDGRWTVGCLCVQTALFVDGTVGRLCVQTALLVDGPSGCLCVPTALLVDRRMSVCAKLLCW